MATTTAPRPRYRKAKNAVRLGDAHPYYWLVPIDGRVRLRFPTHTDARLELDKWARDAGYCLLKGDHFGNPPLTTRGASGGSKLRT